MQLPCRKPPGTCWRHTWQGGVGGQRHPVFCEQLACQDGVGGLPSGGNGARPSKGRQLSSSNPGRHVPRRRKPHEEWPHQVILAAAAWQPVCFCAGRNHSNCLGRWGPSREHVEEVVTIYIAATQMNRRGRTKTNEPAVIHRSSFGEGKGGDLDSFILVPT